MVSRSTAVRSRSLRVTALPKALGRGHPAILLPVTVGALLILGLVMFRSACSVSSFAATGSSFTFFNKQLLWSVVGVAAFVFFARLDYHRLSGTGYLLYVVCAALLLAVLVPGVGIIAGGSSRWLGF